ncbi:hypothetical protein BpHYR1_042536 [Brachionus plicatilis]|uniref:Uncharacterized protein n=1 Tax=Brachionus plicatilis TaxID=10195 RepID=A0A3M7QDE8_BRAPC|nr:hypothetical protein BpHYR1_042536 [Brachionus plicatilis]
MSKLLIILSENSLVIFALGTFWSSEDVIYWLLVNDQSPTPNNPQPQQPKTSNGQKVPTAKNYQRL